MRESYNARLTGGEMTTLEKNIRPRRSLLFVKALESGADIVCTDMEDATPRDRKDEGRGWRCRCSKT